MFRRRRAVILPQGRGCRAPTIRLNPSAPILPVSASIFSMMKCLLMATGSNMLLMVMSGCPVMSHSTGGLTPTANGSGPIMDGRGCRITIGAGRLSITAAGDGTIPWVGSGCRIRSGGRRGLPGGEETCISVGLRFHLRPGSWREEGSPHFNSAYMIQLGYLWHPGIFPALALIDTSFPGKEIRGSSITLLWKPISPCRTGVFSTGGWT